MDTGDAVKTPLRWAVAVCRKIDEEMEGVGKQHVHRGRVGLLQGVQGSVSKNNDGMIGTHRQGRPLEMLDQVRLSAAVIEY